MTCEWTIAHHTYEYCARRRNNPSVLSEMVWTVVVPPPGGFQVYIPSSPSVLMSLYHTEDETSIPRTPSSPPTCLRYLDLHHSSLSRSRSAPRALPLACFARSGPNPNPKNYPNSSMFRRPLEPITIVSMFLERRRS